MQEITGLAIAGLISASLLFMTASGLTLIFGVSRILNLAHGSVFMFAAFLAFQVTSYVAESPIRFWVALTTVPLMTGFLGSLIAVTLLRRVYKADLLAQMLVTVGLIFVLSDVVRMIWGTRQRSVSIPEQLTDTVSIAGSYFPSYYLVVILAGIVVAGCLLTLIHKTRWGLFIRACAQDREMAGALGINEQVVFTSVFALGSLLAGMAGVLAAPMLTVNDALALEMLILALVVVVVGGMGSVVGSIIAAVVVGLVRSYGTLFIPQFELAFVFAAMAIVLVVRPQGLMGRPE